MFLQAVVVLIGVSALAFLLWEPHLEGKNANATPYEIYFTDPFLAYVYLASVSFFTALYHAFRLLGHAGTNRLFSREAVRAVRSIRACSMTLIVSVVVGEIILLPHADELPPPIVMGLLMIAGSTVVAAAMSLSEKVLLREIGVPIEKPLTAP